MKYRQTLEGYRTALEKDMENVIFCFGDGLQLVLICSHKDILINIQETREKTIGTIFQKQYAEVYRQLPHGWELLEVWNG